MKHILPPLTNWAKVRELLQSESGFLSTLDATQRSEVQDKHIAKSLVDLLRAETDLGPLKQFLREIKGVTICSQGFQNSIAHEIGHLHNILEPMAMDLGDDVLKKAKLAIESTTYKIHKALALFPTGQI